MKEKGFEVRGFSTDDIEGRTFANSGFEFIPSRNLTRQMSLLKDIGFIIECYRMLRREKPVIVCTYGPKPGLYARISARLAGVPVVVHTSWGFYFGEKSSWYQKLIIIMLEKMSSFFCDYIFSVNKDDLSLMHKYKFKSRNKLGYLGNGTDVNTKFNPGLTDVPRIASAKIKYGLNLTSLVVGMIGRLTAKKGYRDFFQAARIIRSKYSNVEFVVIGPLDSTKGDGISEKELQELEAAGTIKYLGPKNHDEMPSIYSIMDMVVLPSYREGFPRSLVEAAAMAKPLIASDIRGCREAIEHGYNGYLVKVGDSFELAQGIERLVADEQMRQEMGKNSRKKAVTEFDEQILVDKMIEVYRSLLKEKLPRWPNGV